MLDVLTNQPFQYDHLKGTAAFRHAQDFGIGASAAGVVGLDSCVVYFNDPAKLVFKDVVAHGLTNALGHIPSRLVVDAQFAL